MSFVIMNSHGFSNILLYSRHTDTFTRPTHDSTKTFFLENHNDKPSTDYSLLHRLS